MPKTHTIIDETVEISLTDICQNKLINQEVLLELLEHGLIKEIQLSSLFLSPSNNLQSQLSNIKLNSLMLQRIISACRLKHDLGVNTEGVVIILEMQDELTALKNELDILRRHIEIDVLK